MASDLKPCGGCGATSEQERCIGCLHDFGTPESAWAATRPTPAATDTVSKDGTDGLVTVATYDRKGGFWTVGGYPKIENFYPDGFARMVDRSQAEELLAAKDAENAYLKELVAARGETIKRGDDRIRKLEADNAAKDARIEELSEALGKQRELDNESTLHHYNCAKALEAKLAAAEKALETEKALADRLASALEYIDDYSLSYPDLGTVTAVAQPALEAHSAARAALGGKP